MALSITFAIPLPFFLIKAQLLSAPLSAVVNCCLFPAPTGSKHPPFGGAVCD